LHSRAGELNWLWGQSTAVGADARVEAIDL